MTEFPINISLENDFSYAGRGKCCGVLLNGEWYIVCAFRHKSNSCIIRSIEIHRKNVVGNALVSGNLKILDTLGNVIWKKKFSKFIETGSSGFSLPIMTTVLYGGTLQGLVKISDLIEKPATGLMNIGSKEIMQLKSLNQLSDDLEQFLDPSSSFADVTLKCGDASIPAHKLILSARSPVFAAMFANPMKESLNNEVDITDIDVSILRVMLNYMYTGKTSDLTASSAADLLFAADKYQLQDLKTVCSHFLQDITSLENVLRVLILGDLHAEKLKSFAMNYISTKCAEFSVLEKTEEWYALGKERPALAMEVLTFLVKAKEEKIKAA